MLILEHRQGAGGMAKVGKKLQNEGGVRRVSYLIYRKMIQEVLLFGSESWVMPYMITKTVESTHVVFLNLIMGKRVRCQTYGAWDMPTADEVLQAAGKK